MLSKPAWSCEVPPDEDPPGPAVGARHLDPGDAHVGPVDVAGDPVHRHPVGEVQAELHHDLCGAPVRERPRYRLLLRCKFQLKINSHKTADIISWFLDNEYVQLD